MSRPIFSRSPQNNQASTFSSPNNNHNHNRSIPSSRTLHALPQPGSTRRDQRASMELRDMQRRLAARRGLEENHYLSCRSREHNYNPSVDLRLLDYVSAYDNNLMCPICRCPFVDPVVLAECDHCFCRDCIRQTWNTNATYSPLGPRGQCPSCRTTAKLVPRSAVSKILVNMIDELVVKCPKSNEGCKAEVKRGEVKDHVNIYCGYALVECGAEECELPVQRKAAAQGCLHYGVSCFSCRKEMQKWRLELHWQSECPERKVLCELCQSFVLSRELEEHNQISCSALGLPCPGSSLGCTKKSSRDQAEVHARSCAWAKLAAMLQQQQERMDEQEAAQKQMSRKLEVLENGFAAMQTILYPPTTEREPAMPVLDDNEALLLQDEERQLVSGEVPLEPQNDPRNLQRSVSWPETERSQNSVQLFQTAAMRSPPSGPVPNVPGPRPSDLPEPFTTDFDLDAPTSIPPPDTNGGPYASPLHHLLSMHESLRDEMGRISSVLSELDGRHSMQILNENLRTREEITYLGAQVGGLQRQVHWLTSTQLQRQHVGRSPTPGAAGPASTSIADAATGVGVEAAVSAVSTAATALRGAARMVSVGGREGREGSGMRRGPSEEGRTKL